VPCIHKKNLRDNVIGDTFIRFKREWITILAYPSNKSEILYEFYDKPLNMLNPWWVELFKFYSFNYKWL